MQFIYGTGVETFLRRTDALAEKYGDGFLMGAKVLEAVKRYEPIY